MSIKGNTPMSIEAMKSLLDQLFECDNPYNCAHGRPTIIKFSSYDLDKMFKRAMT
jgi:DNA mismatch repair protein MutL